MVFVQKHSSYSPRCSVVRCGAIFCQVYAARTPNTASRRVLRSSVREGALNIGILECHPNCNELQLAQQCTWNRDVRPGFCPGTAVRVGAGNISGQKKCKAPGARFDGRKHIPSPRILVRATPQCHRNAPGRFSANDSRRKIARLCRSGSMVNGSAFVCAGRAFDSWRWQFLASNRTPDRRWSP